MRKNGNLFVFYGYKQNRHESAFRDRALFRCANLGASGNEAIDYLETDLGMRHFTSLETNDGLDLIAAHKELLRVIDTRFKVVGVDTAGKLNLLELYHLLLLLGFFFLLFAVKAILAVIHNTADGRGCLRCDQHQIKATVIRHLEGGAGGHHPCRP